ncbi:MAG: conjugal transfer protein TraC [Nanoarchaeota archaeon]|nr:conjugal transfer protein TraC [Nanoarchaeota archaeon]
MMAKNKLAKNKISVSTQQYLDIAEIKEDTIVMKDGTLRAVLLVSSINFALKSEDEQNAIISGYVSFLNNIDSPLQIVVQSRELNIDGYISQLKKMEKEQVNELLKIQTAEYIQYVGELISMGKIMNKRFFVSILFNPISDKHKNFFSSLWEAFKPATLIKMKEKRFIQFKTEIDRRADDTIGGLGSIGLNAVRLDTQSLIELFYNTYNPVVSKNEKLVNIDELRVVE